MATLGEAYQIININKVDGKQKRSRKQASSTMKEFDATSKDDVYNIDYHGVKTHPDPTPKHP
ncbi:hypothetical protein Ccrd_025326 [Cynara cardunculus var. scolymus]|uniref:Uncharacterized protein n=1 Tax=Cynara cardunculus var. scolymus TaxID=59895 RepID=A0A103XB28_CYNCS|nr:hypothetical protein Ccrd_025326 [Cynara cardunculus var. scolymus]